MIALEEAYNYLKNNLRSDRYMHTLGVISVAKKLAKLNGVSEEKAEIAALSHDIAKNMSKEDMADIIKQNNIKLSLEESISKQLWHSILAPIVARKELKIEDKDILGAIRWHTTGKENMTKLEKIIYIADMIEPSRQFEGVDEIRNVTLQNLDEGVLLGLTHTIEFLQSKNLIVDNNTINARDYLLRKESKIG